MDAERLPRFDPGDPEWVSVYDELPLWSAPFGRLLLERVPLAPALTVLDVGCGTGFPLLELAERLGPTCTLYGLDPWAAALDRVRRKMERYGIRNVRLVEGDAAGMELPDGSFDLVVSNLGINNFADPDRVLRECRRVLKPGGRLALTTNFRGHMAELYAAFERVLREAGLEGCLPALEAHVAHRSDLPTLRARLERAGFRVTETCEETFRMRFLDGTALLRHHFIRLGFRPAWEGLVTVEVREEVLRRLEERLNDEARTAGELALTVPCGYVAAVKVDAPEGTSVRD